ncbi:MAG: hypothetical protein J5915_03560 [Acidaminococcaceae bacterium]|nr:hypothetical protein [Acidaminococcaceae bacterium]MBO5604442.1 hypothetical protein [Acidaminococcaceae bacterium]MBO6182866.1 hypothetical protein [Acidaminococcaceae bacterium]MBP3264282.1 hypothetical protein [Acidaminococcaceae bacterium]MBQ7418269.1 hypothetical protein [Acidaminococcaceae bacterium]
MKTKRYIRRSVTVLSFLMLSVFLSGISGCAEDKPLVFDYATQPEEFVVKLKPNQRYTIVRGSERFPFSVKLEKSFMGDNGTMHLVWNKIDRKTDMLRAHERVPYLVRANGKDYLYIYGDKYGDLNFIELGEKYVTRSDNTMIHFYDEPKDPKNLPVRIGIHVLGPAAAEIRCHIGKMGAPAPNDPEGYRYCIGEDARQKFVTTGDHLVLVFPSKEAREGKEEVLASGSVFTRLRCGGQNDTDLLLEDGRVFRVKERYLFSEPQAVMDVRDLAGKPFAYKKAN